MQRLHESDLSGHLLARGGWRHICWPMRYDEQIATADDPRTQPGELLWPALFDEEKVRQLELDLGAYAAAGQLQQRPAPAEGGLFKREWFDGRIVDTAPVQARRCRGWDTAATEGAGDYTCGVRIAEADGIYYVEDVQRAQLSPFGVDALIRATVQKDGTSCRQREERTGADGKTVTAHRLKLLAGYDYREVVVMQNKVARAGGFRSQCEGGNVRLVKGSWNHVFLDELCIFPNGDHDDQVDAATCAFNDLTLGAPRITPIPLRGI
jgi:predicted phage terminase large subunit-like protein